MTERQLVEMIRDAYGADDSWGGVAVPALLETARRRRRRRTEVSITAGVVLVGTIIATAVAVGSRDHSADRVVVGSSVPPTTTTSTVATTSTVTVTTLPRGWRLSSPAPVPARSAPMVWTGREVLMIGGLDRTGTFAADGVAYDPATDHWSEVPAAPESFYQAGVWTGTELLVWFGQPAANRPLDATGAAYNPTTRQWRSLGPAPLTARSSPSSVWTGNELIVWGGRADTCLADGAAYNPAADTWRTIATSPLPARCSDTTVVWTGTEVIIWGGFGRDNHDHPDGAAYNPATDTWRIIAPSPLQHSNKAPAAVWTGHEMITLVEGPATTINGNTIATDVASYQPTTDTWRLVARPPADLIGGSPPVWTGQQLIKVGVAGCNTSDPYPLTHNDVTYHPTTDAWATLTEPGDLRPVCGASAVWTGTQLITWGAGEAARPAPDDRARIYTP